MVHEQPSTQPHRQPEHGAFRLGDYLSPDDYAPLYGDHWVTRSSRRTRLVVALVLVAWIFGAAGIAGRTDAEDAANTAQDEQVAHEKAVAHIVCATWICQKYHDHEPCGRNSNTACVSAADLTRNK